ncbi:MAG: hypothetical protein WC606_01445 [Candidatus Absconditabacterales bacterium]
MTITTIRPGINKPNISGLLSNLSDGEKKDLFNDLNAPDLELLTQRKKKLFVAIKTFKENINNGNLLHQELDRLDLTQLLSRLFEHSIEDGLRLAEQLKITPNEYMDIIGNEKFRMKHPAICQGIISKLGDISSRIDNKKRKSIDSVMDMYVEVGARLAKNEDLVTSKPSLTSPLASNLLNEMDDIYSQYLRIQKFESDNPNDPRTIGERLAEDLFTNVENSGKYYKTRVIEAIYDTVVKDIYPAKENYYSNQEASVNKFLKRQGAIEKTVVNKENNDVFFVPETVNNIINIIKTNIKNLNYDEVKSAEQIQEKIKDAIYKPHGMVFSMKNYFAEKQNKAELELSLQQHFGAQREKSVKLVYDRKEGVYKVEEVKDEKTEEIGEQEEVVLGKATHIGTIEKTGEPKIINGKMYFKVRSTLRGGRCLSDENSSIIGGKYEEIGDYIEVNKKLVFTAKKGGIWSVRDENGDAIFMTNDEIKNIIAFKGARVLHIREGGNEYIIRPNGTKISGTHKRIQSLHVVDNALAFIIQIPDGIHYLIHKLGPYYDQTGSSYDQIEYQGDRNSPYPWIARRGNKVYGIDKQLNETESDINNIRGSEKDEKFGISRDAGTWKAYIVSNTKGTISEGFDELYGPREYNDKTMFIGKKDNEFQKLVINATKKIKTGEKARLENVIETDDIITIGEPKIINGKIYTKISLWGGLKQGILDEDGNILSAPSHDMNDAYDEIGNMIEVDGKLVFTAKRNGCRMIVDEKGNREEYNAEVTIQKIMAGKGERVIIGKSGNRYFLESQNGGTTFSDTEITSLYIINNDPHFITKYKDGSSYLNQRESDGSTNRRGPYDSIDYLRNRDTPYIWMARKWSKFYGIDKNRNETEGDFKDISGERKNKSFNIRVNIQTGECFVVDKAGKKILDGCDDIYGPREHDGKTMFIGKKDNQLQRRVIDTEGEITPLGEGEQKKLDLLNLCVPIRERPGNLEEYKEKIEKYLAEESKLKEERKKTHLTGGQAGMQKLKTHIQQSGGFLKFLNATIKQSPERFINTLPAKKDKNEKIMAEEICRRIFPEAFVEEEKGNSWYRGIERNGDTGSENFEMEPIDYLSDYNQYDAMGGDPGAIPEKIMEIRGTINDMFASRILGSCDERGIREKVYFPIDMHISGPQTITTINIPHIKYNQRLILPKPINANVIPERVKGITADGKEIDLQVSTNALNESTVIVGSKNIKEIVYSIEQSILPPKIIDIQDKDYDIFKRKFISMYGEIEKETKTSLIVDSRIGKKITTHLLTQVSQLDEEELLFLDSIKNDAPKQKLIKIEQYVRNHSFYDRNNKEVMNLKAKKSMDEKIYIYKKRIEELKETKTELADSLEGKKRAGVCTDFALISATMLRKAGFLSGLIDGFMPSGSTVNTTDAHGVAFAVLPDEKGKNQIIVVDGTPHGSGNDRPSLAEQETLRTEQEEKIEKELESALEEITKVLDTGNKHEIDALLATMFNGNLEDLLNITLKKEVHLTHYIHLQNLLNAYRYSPLKNSDISLPENQTFIQQEMQREEGNTTKNYQQEAKAGTMLFDMTHQFVNRFTHASGDILNRQKNQGNEIFLDDGVIPTTGESVSTNEVKGLQFSKAVRYKYQALDRLENIVDSCKNLLNTIEYKSIKIIIKYLRAEKIKGK